MSTTQIVEGIVATDVFKNTRLEENFVGRPFYIDYEKLHLLVADSSKRDVGGLPHSSFLLAFYDNEVNVQEALLLRVLKPVPLPTDNEVISSMIEYYKDNSEPLEEKSKLDVFTRYEFSFSGLECRILGTFYKDKDGKICFGADVENFYSANNYSVYKPRGEILKKIVNYRDGTCEPGKGNDERIGIVRYSSSTRLQDSEEDVPVYVYPKDFLGKRTALFGMTRTGKSNTVKKIVQITERISEGAKYKNLEESNGETEPLTKDELPLYPVGQLIFDINGEYANSNTPDKGTSIFELYKDKVIRYSFIDKEGFEVMKVNFYNDIFAGFELIKYFLRDEDSNYVNNFKAIDLNPPEASEYPSTTQFYSAKTRYERLRAAYLCCLYKADFKPPKNLIKFTGNEKLNKLVKEDGSINPSEGITFEDAIIWFSKIWENSESQFFVDYHEKEHHPWIDDALKAVLIFLTKKPTPGGRAQNWGAYEKLRKIKEYHTGTGEEPFDEIIIRALREGKIVIIDLSKGDPEVQKFYSERLCRKIFSHATERFTENLQNNFVQFYFEEAHNLFPKSEDKNLTDIYDRIAKEGAKLNLGLIYATQEVSSISSNILKNTQNWFISHLNNDDEIKEIKKYYDFKDFTDNLILFNSTSDKGFIRMKTYSNSFVVPVHIDLFLADKTSERDQK